MAAKSNVLYRIESFTGIFPALPAVVLATLVRVDSALSHLQ